MAASRRQLHTRSNIRQRNHFVHDPKLSAATDIFGCHRISVNNQEKLFGTHLLQKCDRKNAPHPATQPQRALRASKRCQTVLDVERWALVIGRPFVRAAGLLLCALTCAVACTSQQSASQRAVSHSSAPTSIAASHPAPSHAVAPPTSIASYETETATPAAPTGAHAHPPAVPCVQPADESQAPFDPGFTGILEESDLVIEADIETKFVRLSQDGDQVLWSQLIDNVDVIRSKATPAPHVDGLYAYGDPGQPPYGWPPGRYVLLLLPLRGGLSTPSEGMWGMFRIAGDRALRFCPNYDDPAHPIAASGTPPTVDELLALIPTQLPTDSVAPKPTTAISP